MANRKPTTRSGHAIMASQSAASAPRARSI
jgi:hypothetical protein